MKGPKKKECLVVATLINENVQMAERKNISIHSGNIEDLLCAVSEMNKIDKILSSWIFHVGRLPSATQLLLELDGKESACNVGDSGSIPCSGDPPEKGRNSYPLQYSCLEDSMDRGPWRATVHRFTKSWTQLSD